MTQNSELELSHCFVCHANEYVQISLHQDLLDASDFHVSGQKPDGYSYFLATCKKCGHTVIQTDNPCWMPTRKHDFIKYGEPSEHYPKVSLMLQALKLDFKDTSLHTFSYKDFQLASFLANDLNISDVKLNDHAGCSNDWLPVASSDESERDPISLGRFMTEIENSEKSHQIVLITRFFDHVANITLLSKILGLSSPTRHIIFDLNDYDHLFGLETVDFIWNERRNLMRCSDIKSILDRANLSYSVFTYESLEVAPTLTGVISERFTKASNSCPNESSNSPAHNLIEKLIALRQRWQDKLAETHKLGVIGASHKGISLAQFVLDNRAQYSLHDDKEALRGKAPPVNPPLGFHLVSGFDFSGYTHVVVTTTLAIATKITLKLRASGYTGEILDFDCRILD